MNYIILIIFIAQNSREHCAVQIIKERLCTEHLLFLKVYVSMKSHLKATKEILWTLVELIK